MSIRDKSFTAEPAQQSAAGLAHRLACEWVLLRAQLGWFLLLHVPCVYGSSTLWLNLAEYRHRRAFPEGGRRLDDLGFEILPELPPAYRGLAEVPLVALVLVACSLALASLHHGSCNSSIRRNGEQSACVAVPYIVNMYRRVSTTFLLGQALRAACFLSTTLPGSAPHCLVPRGAASDLARGDILFGRRGRDVLLSNCGDSVFSGHMTLTLSISCGVARYASSCLRVAPRTRALLLCALGAVVAAQVAVILALRNHYTLDVLLALYIIPTLWLLCERIGGAADLAPDPHDLAGCCAASERRAARLSAWLPTPVATRMLRASFGGVTAATWLAVGLPVIALAIALCLGVGLHAPTSAPPPPYTPHAHAAAASPPALATAVERIRRRRPRYARFTVHQTYAHCDESRFPPAWRETPAAWRRAFPEARYRCWSDAALRAIVATEMPQLLATYDAYPHHIMRVDAARYVILASVGGLYADLDMHPTPELVRVVRTAVAEAAAGDESAPPVVLFRSRLSAWWLPPSFQLTNSIMLAASPPLARPFFAFVSGRLPRSFDTTPSLSLLFGNYYCTALQSKPWTFPHCTTASLSLLSLLLLTVLCSLARVADVLTATGSRFLNLCHLAYRGPVRTRLLPAAVTRHAILSLPGSSWHTGPFAAFMRHAVHPWLR